MFPEAYTWQVQVLSALLRWLVPHPTWCKYYTLVCCEYCVCCVMVCACYVNLWSIIGVLYDWRDVSRRKFVHPLFDVNAGRTNLEICSLELSIDENVDNKTGVYLSTHFSRQKPFIFPLSLASLFFFPFTYCFFWIKTIYQQWRLCTIRGLNNGGFRLKS